MSGPRSLLGGTPHRLLLLGFVLAAVPGSGFVTPARNVDVSSAPGPQSEVSIAVDPASDRRLLAGSNDFSEHRVRAYSSLDGGATWTTSTPPRPPAACASVDPGVAVDRGGRQYFAFIAPLRCRSHDSTVGVFVASRQGSAAEWGAPVRVAPAPRALEDKPAIGVDLSPASGHPYRVYVAWTRIEPGLDSAIVVSHSDDSGASWSPAAVVSDRARTPTYASVAVGPQGQVYVAWEDTARSAIFVDESLDGDHFGADRTAAVLAGHLWHSCVPAAGPRCLDAAPMVTVDASGGPFAGRVYVTYGDDGDQGQKDVFLTVFDSALKPLLGWPLKRRAKPIVPAARPAAGDRFWAVSAVDASDGMLWTCFYDTLGEPERVRVFFSCTRSGDGGATWTRPVAAASVPSIEAQRGTDSNSYGDYEGLAAANGVAHPIWTDTRKLATLQEEIYTAAVAEAMAPPPFRPRS